MSTIDAMDRLRRVDPVPEARLDGLPDEAFAEIATMIVAAERDSRSPVVKPGSPNRRPTQLRLPRFAVAIGVACLVVIAAALALRMSDRGVHWGGDPEIVRLAEHSPLVAMEPDRWSVYRVMPTGREGGEVQFDKRFGKLPGPARVTLSWQREPSQDKLNPGGAMEMPGRVAGEAPVLDTTATVYRSEGRPGNTPRYAAIWRDGDFTVSLTGDASSTAELGETLDQVTAMDLNDWLDAIPENFVITLPKP